MQAELEDQTRALQDQIRNQKDQLQAQEETMQSEIDGMKSKNMEELDVLLERVKHQDKQVGWGK